jgi:hypothetical protein
LRHICLFLRIYGAWCGPGFPENPRTNGGRKNLQSRGHFVIE